MFDCIFISRTKFNGILLLISLANKRVSTVGFYFTSADFLASLIIISRPPNKPAPAEPWLLDAGFLAASVSDASDSSVSESSPSFITTGSCLGGAANDTYTFKDTRDKNIQCSCNPWRKQKIPWLLTDQKTISTDHNRTDKKKDTVVNLCFKLDLH